MRIALAQINPTVGDIDANAAKIAEYLGRARDAGADLVAFPELCLCGYPPKDLVLQEGFVRACMAAAKRIGETHTAGLTAVFGLPLPIDGENPARGIANALVVYRDNAYIDYYDKRLLPTYDVFDEDRYFRPGDRAVVIDVPQREDHGGTVRVGLAICEDLWKGEDAGFSSHYQDAADPIAALAAEKARVLLAPSASPFVVGKGRRHRDILISHAKRHGLFVASVNQVGGNDELIFDGHAAVFAPDGSLLGAGPGFEESLLVVDLPIGGDGKPAAKKTAAVEDPRIDASAEQLVFRALTLGVRDYLRKTGFKNAIIGLSGGIDSALTAVVAVAALGKDNVRGISMPSAYSSEHSKSDAFDLAERLGISCDSIPIAMPVDGFRAVLDPAFARAGLSTLGELLPDLTEENLQSRARGTILMAISNRTGAIVLTTGNKSELAVGYCTLYGDMNGGLAVLSDVTKQMVYRVSRWVNEHHAACGFDRPPIPEGSITKPPSAELRPDQTDQDSLPPYDILDEIIERYVEGRQSAAAILKAGEGRAGFDEETVRRILRLIDLSEYKRKQAAIGLKVTSVAFGSGRRWPIAQRWKP